MAGKTNQPAQSEVASDLLTDVPEGLRLQTFRAPFTLQEINSASCGAPRGKQQGSLHDGGSVTGECVWIVATPLGTVIGVRNGDGSVKRLLVSAQGCGVVA